MSTSIKIGLLTLISLGLLVGLSQLMKSKINDTEELKTPAVTFLKLNKEGETYSKGLEKIVTTNINNYIGETEDENAKISIVVETLPATDSAKINKPESYRLNDTEQMYSASLYKLITIAAIMSEIEEGDLTYESVLVGSKSQLTSSFGGVDYGYENAPATISYTVDQAIDRVARISDNFAAIMLTNKIFELNPNSGYKNPVMKTVKQLGLEQTDFEAGDYVVTSASDIAKFFRLLYQGKVVSESASDKIIEYLLRAQLNNRIPAQLPKEIKIAHKTGELSRLRHDAGIVYLENRPYLIVMMTSDVKFEDTIISMMATLSGEVFEYFKGQTLNN